MKLLPQNKFITMTNLHLFHLSVTMVEITSISCSLWYKISTMILKAGNYRVQFRWTCVLIQGPPLSGWVALDKWLTFKFPPVKQRQKYLEDVVKKQMHKTLAWHTCNTWERREVGRCVPRYRSRMRECVHLSYVSPWFYVFMMCSLFCHQRQGGGEEGSRE